VNNPQDINVYLDPLVENFPTRLRKQPGITIHKYAPSDLRKGCNSDHTVLILHCSTLNGISGTDMPEPASVILIDPDGRCTEDTEGRVFRKLAELPCEEAILEIIRSVDKTQMMRRLMNENDRDLKRKEQINRELLGIAIALSAERDNEKLLNLILEKCREITHSDAGSLYLLERDAEGTEQTLLFKIAQNDSNPTDFTEFRMPLNTASIAGYVAVTGKVLSIPDAYTISAGSGVVFNKSYDEATGYRTKSMLTLPMMNHKGKVIGVIQLLNKKKKYGTKLADREITEREVIPYDRENEEIILALSSLAAVSLENNLLYNEIETLFEGFVQASVKAIESRDPTTSGHSNRVALYTVGLAQAVNRRNSGKYKDVFLTEENIKEIRYASLLHDFGKVGVREHVLVKAKKLYPDQVETIKARFAYIQKCIEAEYLARRLTVLEREGAAAYAQSLPELEAQEKEDEKRIREYLDTILDTNESKFLDEEPAKILVEIAGRTYTDINGHTHPYLSDYEFDLLSIQRGSLNRKERQEIESHVIHSYEFLKNIPWTSTMKDIPEISRSHHEVLTGNGYPDGLDDQAIPFASKMMMIADLFDALTASDRPYKKALTKEEALDILRKEAEEGKVDRELVSIFIEDRVFTLES